MLKVILSLSNLSWGRFTVVNEIRSTNRKTHKEISSRLEYIMEDLKRLEPHEEKAVR
jgi:hypothetical protein